MQYQIIGMRLYHSIPSSFTTQPVLSSKKLTSRSTDTSTIAARRGSNTRGKFICFLVSGRGTLGPFLHYLVVISQELLTQFRIMYCYHDNLDGRQLELYCGCYGNVWVELGAANQNHDYEHTSTLVAGDSGGFGPRRDLLFDQKKERLRQGFIHWV